MSSLQCVSDNPAAPQFPRGALAFALVAMVLVTTVGIAVNLFIGERVKTITTSQIEVISAARDVAYLSEEKDRAMDLAIETGSASYLEERGAVQARLEERLAALEQAIQLPENRETFRQAFAAAGQLRAVQDRQTLLLASGQGEQARALRRSDRTVELRQTFTDLIAAIERRSENFVDESSEEIGFWLQANLFGNLLAILLIGATMGILARRTRSWAKVLSHMEREARKGEQAKADFLATMSHEIRTPLNGVIGFAELLHTDPTLGAEQRRQVGLIQSAGSMLLTVVNDVLDFSRLEAERFELSREPFSLATLLDQCVSIVRPMAAEKKLRMAMHIDEALSPWHLGDSDRLRQIMLNLLNNAVKFTQSGTVSIAVWREAHSVDAETVTIEVADTGIGIPEDRMARLFEPFMQADSNIAKHFGGSGLGLSICRRLVTLMGGEITLESTQGEGSKFTVRVELPRAEPSAAFSNGESEGSQGARILLVEDLPMNREIACSMLSRSGHTVQCAHSGEQALGLATSQDFDLILMDIQMPGMDGVETTRRIRALPGARGTVLIVAMTANTMPHQIIAYQKAGMDRHIAKPLRQADLDNTIEDFFTRTAARLPVPETECEGTCHSAAFDSEAFDRIAAILPHHKLAGHLAALQALVHSACDRDCADDELEAMAHKVGSQAAALGLVRLSNAARGLEDGLREGLDVAAQRQALAGASPDVECRAAARLRQAHAA